MMLESILQLTLILILGGPPGGAVSRGGFFLTALSSLSMEMNGDLLVGHLIPGQHATSSTAQGPPSAPRITLLESVVKTLGQSLKARGRFTSSEPQPSPLKRKTSWQVCK